jgi:hypothetical protein
MKPFVPLVVAFSAVVPSVASANAARPGEVSVEKTAYLNVPACLRLTNGTVELVATTGVGPRVLRYALVGGENIFGEHPEMTVETDLGTWRAYGGHRLWTAPEGKPRSYSPDNSPVEVSEPAPGTLRLLQTPESATGIQKEMTLSLGPSGSRVSVHHKLTNRSLWAVDVAPWALTIMRGGGTAILPQEPYRAHTEYLLPARPMVLWHYTDLSDPRFAIGKRLIRLTSDPSRTEPQKLGMANKQGWAAYAYRDTVFLKTVPFVADSTYPDFGCNTEIFTSGNFIEVETLGPMVRLEPGASAEHEEVWSLAANVSLGKEEGAVLGAIRALLAGLLTH